MPIIETLAKNACECLQNDLNQALEDLAKKAEDGVRKLNRLVTGPLNEPVNKINDTILQEQHDLATEFQDQLQGAVKDITDGVFGSSLNSSCFLKPFADVAEQTNRLIGRLADTIRDLDLRIPTLDLKFQISLSTNICGNADEFTAPLLDLLASAGLSIGGAFDIATAFEGMIFPPDGNYEALFKETVGSLVDVKNMEGMIDNVLSAVNGRVDEITGKVTEGVDAVKDWGKEAAKTFNEVKETIADPSKALMELQNSIPLPGVVAWAAQFAGLFGFDAPGVAGGGSPKKPRDVNYLTEKIAGERANTLLQQNDLQKSTPAGSFDQFSGFHGSSDIGTDAGLGRELKSVMGMTDSPLSNGNFASIVKKVAGEMSVEGFIATTQQKPFPETVATLNANSPFGGNFGTQTFSSEDGIPIRNTQKLNTLVQPPGEDQRFSSVTQPIGSGEKFEKILISPSLSNLEDTGVREGLLAAKDGGSLPPANTIPLSALTSRPTEDSRLAALASSQPGSGSDRFGNISAQQSGNDNNGGGKQITTSTFPGNSPRFESVVESRSASTSSQQIKSLLENPGSDAALVARSSNPLTPDADSGEVTTQGQLESDDNFTVRVRENNNAALIVRATQMIQEQEATPPPHLAEFLTQFENF